MKEAYVRLGNVLVLRENLSLTSYLAQRTAADGAECQRSRSGAGDVLADKVVELRASRHHSIRSGAISGDETGSSESGAEPFGLLSLSHLGELLLRGHFLDVKGRGGDSEGSNGGELHF